jgi:hypothetical protein
MGEEFDPARWPRLRGGGDVKGEGEGCEGLPGEYAGAAAQWCSMTRSTMLYSFASSAVMK